MMDKRRPPSDKPMAAHVASSTRSSRSASSPFPAAWSTGSTIITTAAGSPRRWRSRAAIDAASSAVGVKAVGVALRKRFAAIVGEGDS